MSFPSKVLPNARVHGKWVEIVPATNANVSTDAFLVPFIVGADWGLSFSELRVVVVNNDPSVDVIFAVEHSEDSVVEDDEPYLKRVAAGKQGSVHITDVAASTWGLSAHSDPDQGNPIVSVTYRVLGRWR
jgi:hypothetical protein